ncbi:MAG TPA: NAD-dependent epimerase/dehydratase family protein [Capillimicrobium sp.]|nr:NAD-dependent epimerase/dehydratase family protein [Capillimicrobium sp.]
MALTVAVTGATGDLGRPLLRALERAREVGRVEAMARRPYDPDADGLRKVRFRRGDVTRPEDVAGLVAGADVVVHLAFVIMAGSDASEQVNLEGSRNVFRAAVEAKAARLVYASSVAAYGFHEDNPSPLTEDVPVRPTDRHPYSRHKAEVEAALGEVTAGQAIDAYVLRPCIVGGPDAPMLVQELPYIRLAERLPRAVRALFDSVPVLKPVLPDPGIPFQLVHQDDAASALRAAVLGRGEPGVYNVAGPGTVTVGDLADALRWYSVPVPELAVDATAEILARLPFVPDEARWIEALRAPVIMSTAKARRELRWRPRHDARSTLQATVEAARADLER